MEFEATFLRNYGTGGFAMNNSINYSGFIDLLKKPKSEVMHLSEIKKDDKQEPFLHQTTTRSQGTPALTEQE